ncbi:unnamed protein product [Rhizoctonia solani]|uniref:Transcription regulator Rua1 C-terminal domain-containing protein n=1 Tax=Rhizoctonia solani TaxID=456999 RepID=A0A8H3DFZ5_9AGAM|nr:unnamed protein product [Rhizoctonia solani]
MCYPSAEPLDDDPFLVRAPKSTESRLVVSRLIDPLDFTGPVPSASITPLDDSPSINSINTGRSSRKYRVPKGRVGGRVKKLMPRPKAAHHKSGGALSSESNQLIPSPPPHSSAPPPKFSFSLPSTKTELLPELSDELSVPGEILNDKNPATPSTQFYAATGALPSSKPFSQRGYTNPSTTARTLFPIPSLTSSFGTPSTASILPTPSQTALFPSPDITDSPTIRRSTRDWGRVTRSRLRYNVPTPMVEHDLIGGPKLAEPTPDHQLHRYNLAEVRWNSTVQAREPDVIGSPSGNQESIPTNAGDVSSHEGVNRGENLDRSQVASSKPAGEQFPLVPSSSSDEPEQSSPVISTAETPTHSLVVGQSQVLTSIESPTNKSLQPNCKRAREKSDEDGVPAATKRVKVVDESDSSASPIRAGGSTEIDILHRELGFGRATRSQARAVAALLALASSGDNQTVNENQTGGANKGNSQSRTQKTETPATRRTSTRLKGKLQSSDTPIQTPGRSQRTSDSTKRGVIGPAPSRAADTPSNSAPKMISTTSTRIQPPGGIIAERISSKVQVRVAKTEAGNRDDSQGANHVPAAHQVPSQLLPRPHPSLVYGSDGKVIRRSLPKGLPIHEAYPNWYRRFPVSAYFMKDDPVRQFVLGNEAIAGTAAIPTSGLVPNPAPYFNLYTSRFMRGVSHNKSALCPICVEPVWRGGQGQKVLLKTKISQYNYHMQHYHGLSFQTGLPFSPPIAFRQTKRRWVGVREREVVEEGKCHVCKKWIPIESVKLLNIVVPEIFWWKHASSCHGESRLAGDENPYIEDNVYHKLREYEGRLNKNQAPTEEPGSKDGALESHSPDATGMEPGDRVEIVGQDDPTPGNASMIEEEPNHMGNQELSISDSDLTDLDAEGEDTDTSNWD